MALRCRAPAHPCVALGLDTDRLDVRLGQRAHLSLAFSRLLLEPVNDLEKLTDLCASFRAPRPGEPVHGRTLSCAGLWDDSGTQGVIKNVYVNPTSVRRAARVAGDAGDLSAGQMLHGTAVAVSAVPGSETARAFGQVSESLEARVHALQSALQGWADDVHTAVAACEAVDALTADEMSRTSWHAV